jgi:hypothetical protein
VGVHLVGRDPQWLLVRHIVSRFSVVWETLRYACCSVGVAGRGLGAPRGLVASSRIQAGLAQRARIVLLAADGLANTDIATRVGVSRPIVTANPGPVDAPS